MILINELYDINIFENTKQLNAFCGLNPDIVQPDKSINYNGQVSKHRNRNTRKILFITYYNIIRSSVLHNIDTDILI